MSWRLENDPVDAEREFLGEFVVTMGGLPFANLVHGTRRDLVA